MDGMFNSDQIKEEVFPHKIGFNSGGGSSPIRDETSSVSVPDLSTFDSSKINGTEEFPSFHSTSYESDLFLTDQSTTIEDQAEFITHTSSNINNTNNSGLRSSPAPLSTGTSNENSTQKTSSTLPRRQRGNSNDRSRMRAEEICQEDINFVSQLICF